MKVALLACSNGIKEGLMYQIERLVEVLENEGIEVVVGDNIVAKVDDFSASDEVRARDLMRFYEDESLDIIFDISGGDLSNGLLKFLDFDLIKKSNVVFIESAADINGNGSIEIGDAVLILKFLGHKINALTRGLDNDYYFQDPD